MFVSHVLPQRLLGAAVVLVVSASASRLDAQSAADHIALGDREHVAMNAPSALQHYQEAIKVDPRSYEALWKATREAVDIGEYAPKAQRDSLYTAAESYARRAVEANPGHAEGHFHLSRSLGRKALSVGKRDQVRYAADVRTQSLEALKLNPKHPGALHVMGMWNYNVMKLNGMQRFMAKNFLGGNVFDSATWDEARRFMEESVAVEPNRLVHHLDLARVLAARGNKDKAREHYQHAVNGTRSEYNDRHYQAAAADELKKL